MDDQVPEPDAVPEELLHLVKPELQPGERLLWASFAQAKPPAGLRSPIRALVVMITGFGLAAGAFFTIFGPYRPKFLGVENLLIGTGVIACLVGIISAIVAFFAWTERWWEHDRFASNTYALTDRRAIIWIPQQNSKAVEVHTFPRSSIKSLHRLEYPDGSGSVRFNYGIEDYYGPITGFESVADVRFVEDLTRRTLIDAERSAST